MLGDAAVAGLGPLFGDMPPCWNTYVTVADADEAAAAASAAGGRVLMEPMDVLDAGRMAGIMPIPAAPPCRSGRPGNHIGAEVRMEPNAMCWVELNTRRP